MRASEFIVEYQQLPTQEFEGMDFRIVVNNGQLFVNALDDWGNELGHVTFNIGDSSELDPQDLFVKDKFRGQGIARTMYDFVKSKGYKIVRSWDQTDDGAGFWDKHRGTDERVWENFADGKVKGKSRPGRVKRSGASCDGSVTDLRARAKRTSGEKAKMYHWCANMKSGRAKHEDVNEIARLPKSDMGDFGDKGTLADPTYSVKKKPLPGGTGFTYAVTRDDENLEIMIFDGDTLAAELDLFYTQDFMKTWRVETVVTDPDYRGRGLGKALYGIALSILKLTIEAGDTQTRHGQQMWLMLNSIPGVTVQGYNREPTSEYKPQRGDNIVDQNKNWTRYTFPVMPGSTSMRSGRRGTGIYTTQASMIAKWSGQQ